MSLGWAACPLLASCVQRNFSEILGHGGSCRIFGSRDLVCTGCPAHLARQLYRSRQATTLSAKRKRGRQVPSSLALRASVRCVQLDRERYNCVPHSIGGVNRQGRFRKNGTGLPQNRNRAKSPGNYADARYHCIVSNMDARHSTQIGGHYTTHFKYTGVWTDETAKIDPRVASHAGRFSHHLPRGNQRSPLSRPALGTRTRRQHPIDSILRRVPRLPRGRVRRRPGRIQARMAKRCPSRLDLLSRHDGRMLLPYG